MNAKYFTSIILLMIAATALVFLVFFVQPVSAQEFNPQYECPYCVVLQYETQCNSWYCLGDPNKPHLQTLYLRCYDCETHQYYITQDKYCSFLCL